jgi:hypothetical protein
LVVLTPVSFDPNDVYPRYRGYLEDGTQINLAKDNDEDPWVITYEQGGVYYDNLSTSLLVPTKRPGGSNNGWRQRNAGSGVDSLCLLTPHDVDPNSTVYIRTLDEYNRMKNLGYI